MGLPRGGGRLRRGRLGQLPLHGAQTAGQGVARALDLDEDARGLGTIGSGDRPQGSGTVSAFTAHHEAQGGEIRALALIRCVDLRQGVHRFVEKPGHDGGERLPQDFGGLTVESVDGQLPGIEHQACQSVLSLRGGSCDWRCSHVDHLHRSGCRYNEDPGMRQPIRERNPAGPSLYDHSYEETVTMVRFIPSSVPMLLIIAALVGTPLRADTLIVANKSEATVSLVDLESGEVKATLPTGAGPHEVAISADGKTAVITDYGARQPGSTLTVVDIPRAEVLRTIDLGEYRRPHGIVFLNDDRVLVTVEGNQAVIEVDVEQGKVVRAMETGQEVSHMVAVPHSGKRAYVANIGSGTVTVLDLATGEKLGDVATGEGAEGVAVTPDGSQVWVTNRAAGTVSLVDPETLQVVESLESEGFPIRAEITPDGTRVLVTNARAGDLTVIDTKGKEVARRVSLKLPGGAETETKDRLFGDRFGDSSVPIGIEIAPSGDRAFIAHANADVVQVLDLDTWETIEVLDAGAEPDGMGYSPVEVEAPGADT